MLIEIRIKLCSSSTCVHKRISVMHFSVRHPAISPWSRSRLTANLDILLFWCSDGSNRFFRLDCAADERLILIFSIRIRCSLVLSPDNNHAFRPLSWDSPNAHRFPSIIFNSGDDEQGQDHVSQICSLKKEPMILENDQRVPKTIAGYLDLYSSVGLPVSVDPRTFLFNVSKFNNQLPRNVGRRVFAESFAHSTPRLGLSALWWSLVGISWQSIRSETKRDKHHTLRQSMANDHPEFESICT